MTALAGLQIPEATLPVPCAAAPYQTPPDCNAVLRATTAATGQTLLLLLV